MQRQAPGHKSFIFTPPSPRLSLDILYLVANLSPFETRAILVQCNKWLHATCTPLLFRDIYIRTPMQLVRLYENKKAVEMLNRTKALYISENLFYRSVWAPLKNDGSDYIISVLAATTSLIWLQIIQCQECFYIELQERTSSFDEKLRSLSTDPMFLPGLEVIIESHGEFLALLCDNRPVQYYSCFRYDYHMHAVIYPSLRTETPKSSAFDSALLERATSLSASEIGTLIRQSKANFLLDYPYLELDIQFPNEIRNEGFSPIHDPISWMRELVLAAEFASDELQSLCISFNPATPHVPASKQLAVIEELQKIIPTLNNTISLDPGIHWTRDKTSVASPDHKGEFYSLQTLALPTWVPGPTAGGTDAEVIDWWLDFLGLKFPDAGNYEQAVWAARRVRDAMCLRWDSDDVATVASITRYLLGGDIED